MLEKSENRAGCEFRDVSLLRRSRCGRKTAIGALYIIERQLLRLADCSLLMFIVGALSAVGH